MIKNYFQKISFIISFFIVSNNFGAAKISSDDIEVLLENMPLSRLLNMPIDNPFSDYSMTTYLIALKNDLNAKLAMTKEKLKKLTAKNSKVVKVIASEVSAIVQKLNVINSRIDESIESLYTQKEAFTQKIKEYESAASSTSSLVISLIKEELKKINKKIDETKFIKKYNFDIYREVNNNLKEKFKGSEIVLDIIGQYLPNETSSNGIDGEYSIEEIRQLYSYLKDNKEKTNIKNEKKRKIDAVISKFRISGSSTELLEPEEAELALINNKINKNRLEIERSLNLNLELDVSSLLSVGEELNNQKEDLEKILNTKRKRRFKNQDTEALYKDLKLRKIVIEQQINRLIDSLENYKNGKIQQFEQYDVDFILNGVVYQTDISSNVGLKKLHEDLEQINISLASLDSDLETGTIAK